MNKNNRHLQVKVRLNISIHILKNNQYLCQSPYNFFYVISHFLKLEIQISVNLTQKLELDKAD